MLRTMALAAKGMLMHIHNRCQYTEEGCGLASKRFVAARLV
jgi:hypothetical protein